MTRLVLGILALCAMLALKLAMAIPMAAIPMAHAAIASPIDVASIHSVSAAPPVDAAPCHPPKHGVGASTSEWPVSCAAACAELPALAIEFAPGAELRGIVVDSALADQLYGRSPEIEVPPPR